MELHRYIPSYTVEDYEHWEGDWELWEGLPVAMSPSPRRDHQAVIGNLLLMIQRQLLKHEGGCRCDVVQDLDWRVNHKTVVRPDVSILCDEKVRGDFIVEPPTVVIEVLSPSNHPREMEWKKALYAREQVRYYIELDTFERRIHVWKLNDREYREGGFPLELHEGCLLTIDDPAVWAGTNKLRRM